MHFFGLTGLLAIRFNRVPRHFTWRRAGLLCWWGFVLASSTGAQAAAPDFQRDIQPIFAERCYSCHGPEKQKAGLRLDQRASALRGGESGQPALVPGQSTKSRLIQLITSQDADQAMPPKGDRLTTAQVELVRAWIEAGASWPETTGSSPAGSVHWAFQAPHRPAIPATRHPRWIHNPIDAFVVQRLEKEKLSPAPEADRITLIRRLNLDLLGLPPTPAEVDEFVRDRAPGAYERLVERLLASPHYGERWGRHWLDAARYADSDGFEKDKPRFIWNYRDYVVQALNRDLPYDQFIVEQVAGDLLPEPTQDQLIATGFLRNAMLNEEGGVDPEQFRTDGLFDRMDALGKSVLGLTIQCCQCHNHKYDPMTQEEYYRLFAFLNNDHEASTVAYGPAELKLRDQLLSQMRAEEEELRRRTPDWEKRLAAWEDSVRQDQPDWTVVPCIHAGDNGERFYYYADGSIRAASYAPTQWTAHFRGTNLLGSIGAFRLEQLTDPNLPCHGPGRSIRGMSALSEFKVEATDLAHPTNKITVKFVRATADYENPVKTLEPEFQSDGRNRNGGDKRTYGPVAFAMDGNGDTAWGIDAGPGRRNVPRQAVFVPEKPVVFAEGVILDFYLQQNHGGDNSDDNQNHNLGRFRLSVTGATNAVADPVPRQVRDILAIARDQRTPAQQAAVFSYWRTLVPEFKEANDRIEAWWKQWPEGAPTLTLERRKGVGPGEEWRATRVFKRGDWLKPAQEVTAGVPAFLHPLPTQAEPTRLTLARWLVDPRSPTTARVAVNRVWQTYFGVGLVETPEDLGRQSPAPSHPELLDWLACEFVDRGWSLKNLHRLIVQSATYRQSARVTPALYEKDRYNRLLARGPRFRVEGETVRDLALAASGLLNPALGGPPVYSPSPRFLYLPPASYGPKVWNEATGPDRYRRGLYTFRFRSVPYPVLQNFDAPNGDFSCVRRQSSNTPLQALTTLNEVVFMECAQALARRTLEEGGRSEAEKIQYAFRRVLSRPPTAAERADLLGLLHRQQRHLGEGWVNVNELASGKSEPAVPLPAGATPTEWAAYTVVARVLLNLDEAITKE